MPIANIDEVIEDIRNGRMVILVNEDAPESDGFFCLPAETTTADSVNHLLHYGRGVIFLALTEERIRELGILLIPQESGSFGGHFFGVPFSLRLEGVASVSTQGRAHTIRTSVAKNTQYTDLIVPGHVQPIQAHSGGVLARSGRAEAAVDLARLAGFKPAGVICQILED
ncbi:MAG TPA: 3,4-dihydroxy-2-butanone-4-phosphate synthase, partial [Candidatus Limnocylindria bacterium]|nr:3,4-dihydroxy-2-butanone-4-phosphate synthase [Candidatus Limnocylindria bacterium]